jgi:hypothetical protein
MLPARRSDELQACARRPVGEISLEEQTPIGVDMLRKFKVIE